jgi:hypothetical protein
LTTDVHATRYPNRNFSYRSYFGCDGAVIVTISSKNWKHHRQNHQPIEVHELIIRASELTALLAKRSEMVFAVVDQHERFPVYLGEREG